MRRTGGKRQHVIAAKVLGTPHFQQSGYPTCSTLISNKSSYSDMDPRPNIQELEERGTSSPTIGITAWAYPTNTPTISASSQSITNSSYPAGSMSAAVSPLCSEAVDGQSQCRNTARAPASTFRPSTMITAQC